MGIFNFFPSSEKEGEVYFYTLLNSVGHTGKLWLIEILFSKPATRIFEYFFISLRIPLRSPYKITSTYKSNSKPLWLEVLFFWEGGGRLGDIPFYTYIIYACMSIFLIFWSFKHFFGDHHYSNFYHPLLYLDRLYNSKKSVSLELRVIEVWLNSSTIESDYSDLQLFQTCLRLLYIILYRNFSSFCLTFPGLL